MHLINIQKSLKSIDLAMRQQIDFTWLVQKTRGQVSFLRLEAETIGEEELAGVAGQVEAYFDTVSEGRLDLDEEGLAVILDFVNIYKKSIADAVSGTSSSEKGLLEQWSSRYQALMARMKPSYEDTLLEPEKAVAPEPELLEEPAAASDDPVSTPEPADTESVEPDLAKEMPCGFIHEAPDGFAAPPFEDAPEEEAEPVEQTEELKEPGPEPDDEIPLYDPTEQARVRDVIISDAEIKSAREYMEMGKSKPELHEPDEEDEAPGADPLSRDRSAPVHGPTLAPISESPVELQEVERLKAKLSQVHEKHELLLTKMNSILGNYKKAVQDEAGGPEPPSIEDLDLEELEEIIFIGRNKG